MRPLFEYHRAPDHNASGGPGATGGRYHEDALGQPDENPDIPGEPELVVDHPEAYRPDPELSMDIQLPAEEEQAAGAVLDTGDDYIGHAQPPEEEPIEEMPIPQGVPGPSVGDGMEPPPGEERPAPAGGEEPDDREQGGIESNTREPQPAAEEKAVERPAGRGIGDFLRGVLKGVRSIPNPGEDQTVGPNTPHSEARETSMLQELPCPDRLRVVIPTDVSPEARANVAAIIRDGMPMPSGLPLEIPHDPDLTAQIKAVREAVLEWGRQPDLEVDLSDRVPSEERVHIFDQDGFRRVKTARLTGDTYAINEIGSGHILVGEQAIPEATLFVVNYGLAQSVNEASVVIGTDEAGQPASRLVSWGYTNYDDNGAFAALSRGLDAINNVEIIGKWPAELAGDTQDTARTMVEFMHGSDLVFVDGLVQAVADKQQVEPKLVLRALQRDQIMGGSVALRNMLIVLGIADDDALLGRFKQVYRRSDIANMAGELGLRQVSRNLRALEGGRSVEVFPYVSRGIKAKLQSASR